MRILILISVVILLLGCGATVPYYKVSNPWTRTFQLQEKLVPGIVLSTEVIGNTEPLIGEEVLLEAHLESILEQLLTRRGYAIDNQSAEFEILLNYHTEKKDKIDISTTQSSSNISFQSLSSGSMGSASGVAIAAAVSRLANLSETQYSQRISSNVEYRHTIALEVRSNKGNIIWIGESVWDSPSLNIENGIFTVLQVLLSEFPSDNTIFPRVEKLKESHLENYFAMYCADNWFKCPALPYRIYFKNSTTFDGDYYRKSRKRFEYLEGASALPAYVDLVQTAEFALPIGKEKYDDPTDLELWKIAMLGSKYYVGNSEQPQNILIELYGESSGYIVSRCWIATDEEYSNFEKKMKDWKNSLNDYFDMYVK